MHKFLPEIVTKIMYTKYIDINIHLKPRFFLISRFLMHAFCIILHRMISFQIVFAYFRNLCYNNDVMFIAIFVKQYLQIKFF